MAPPSTRKARETGMQRWKEQEAEPGHTEPSGRGEELRTESEPRVEDYFGF